MPLPTQMHGSDKAFKLPKKRHKEEPEEFYPMDNLLYKVVERIFFEKGSFSRNKNFEAFQDPTLRKATRIVRFLTSLRADLLRAQSPEYTVTLTCEEPALQPRYKLVITHPTQSRTAFLNTHELSILARDPALTEVFQNTPTLTPHLPEPT